MNWTFQWKKFQGIPFTGDELGVLYKVGRRNFSWLNLKGADLRATDLSGDNLSRAHLEGYGLCGVQGADLRGANYNGNPVTGKLLDELGAFWDEKPQFST
jgi:uncharacterized protein YjbI with pentapeptide repeats